MNGNKFLIYNLRCVSASLDFLGKIKILKIKKEEILQILTPKIAIIYKCYYGVLNTEAFNNFPTRSALHFSS